MSSGRRGGADQYTVLSGGAADPIVLAGTVDPSAGAGVAAPEGSTYLRYVATAGQLWIKTGAAATAWLLAVVSQVWVDDGTNITPVNAAARVLRLDSAGNARGANAVDLQQSRAAATQVASAARSAILTGQNNTANNTDAAVLSGTGNTASGPSSTVVGGTNNSATQSNAVAWGSSCLANTAYATAFGQNTQTTGSHALAFGFRSDARFQSSMSQAGGMFATSGDAQTVKVVARRLTTTVTPSVLTTDGNAPAAGNTFVLQNSEVWLAEVSITAKEVGVPTNCAAYALRCQIIRDAGGAATTAIVGAVNKTVINEVDPAWDAGLSADTVNGALQIDVTGKAGTNIRWVATVRLTIVR